MEHSQGNDNQWMIRKQGSRIPMNPRSYAAMSQWVGQATHQWNNGANLQSLNWSNQWTCASMNRERCSIESIIQVINGSMKQNQWDNGHGSRHSWIQWQVVNPMTPWIIYTRQRVNESILEIYKDQEDHGEALTNHEIMDQRCNEPEWMNQWSNGSEASNTIRMNQLVYEPRRQPICETTHQLNNAAQPQRNTGQMKLHQWGAIVGPANQ